jgi:hypothetical protein
VRVDLPLDPEPFHELAIVCYAIAFVTYPRSPTVAVEAGALGITLDAIAAKLERLAARTARPATVRPAMADQAVSSERMTPTVTLGVDVAAWLDWSAFEASIGATIQAVLRSGILDAVERWNEENARMIVAALPLIRAGMPEGL